MGSSRSPALVRVPFAFLGLGLLALGFRAVVDRLAALCKTAASLHFGGMEDGRVEGPDGLCNGTRGKVPASATVTLDLQLGLKICVGESRLCPRPRAAAVLLPTLAIEAVGN